MLFYARGEARDKIKNQNKYLWKTETEDASEDDHGILCYVC